MKISLIQAAMLKDYDDGVHFAEIEHDSLREGYDFNGDKLIAFLIDYVKDDGTTQAINRLKNAHADLEACCEAVMRLRLLGSIQQLTHSDP